MASATPQPTETTPSLPDERAGEKKEKDKMSKYIKNNKKYWEEEKGETIEFGNSFMRCFDKAGKLQFGNRFQDKNTGEWVYAVKFVIDRKELFDSEEGYDYLKGTLEDWKQMHEEGED